MLALRQILKAFSPAPLMFTRELRSGWGVLTCEVGSLGSKVSNGLTGAPLL